MNNDPLVQALLDEIEYRGDSLKSLEKRSGVGRNTIKGWGFRSSPRLQNFVAVANTLGLEVKLEPMTEAHRKHRSK